MEPGFYLRDCMEAMREFPDKFFDLAIVDPPYGGITPGGYMKNNTGGKGAAAPKKYNMDLWGQEAPGIDYFQELFRVSKNQIIWGATTTRQRSILIRNAGLCGIKRTTTTNTPIANWRGHRSTRQHGYSGLCGTGCCRAI